MKMTEDRRQMTIPTSPSSVCGRRSSVFAVRSSIPGLRSFLLAGAWLVLASLLFSAALAAEGDMVFKRQGGEGGTPLAVFPHWVHRIRYKCYACHNALFKMKAGANKVSMDAIQQGKFCGACHNEKIAWGVTFETCNRCHVGK